MKDTVFTTKADSSFYKAFVDCRDGKPILITDNFPSGEKSEVVKKGNYVQPPKVNLSQDGVLTVDCKAEAQKLFASWKNTYINEQEPVIVPSTIRLYDESLAPWYVKVQIWAGRILLLLIGIGLIIEAYNLIKRK
ncbi:hypothetical protein [Soonwooa sp.]|uniref:hypothetical protein n=1 Tax=Soonwooa sp. TaxID=1938592 RepID=UPI0028A6FA55|nr:hypothetical protein [Soonwooa sp.]